MDELDGTVMRVYSKNACISTDVKLWALINETKDIQWDIICFSETRAPDSNVELTGGHRLICSRGDQKYAGVAILIHARWSDSIINISCRNGRLMWVDLTIGAHTHRYISVYAPHAGYPFAEFQALMDSIREVVTDTQRRSYKCILGGDLNTEIGRVHAAHS